MRIKLPHYTSKDYYVLGFVIVPFTLIMNGVIFGSKYFNNWLIFTEATLITGLAFCIDFVLCGAVAVSLKKRFPKESEAGRRLTFMIIIFLLITGLFLLLLFRGYETIGFWGYTFNERGFVWSYVLMGIINIFLTFLHEGIANFEKWKANLKETEALQNAYRQSRIQGLKSQVNPHFLFNSLNTLSSLIGEDEGKAEKFLDEMSKVYRYMLRNEDDKLVTVQTELNFLQSYLYLLQTRYCESLKVNIEIDEEDREKYIPPLALQVIIENAFTQNAMSREHPLTVSLSSDKERNTIIICNNVRPKMVTDTIDFEAGLDNLVTKYQLINQSDVVINEKADSRSIHLPLISNREEIMI